ncbi:MAG TPA: molybdopterin molybdotransferase MoeA [Candidatus Tumulicola sp.]|jgi:molybdenum cofactor synthesis domain-containing protein
MEKRAITQPANALLPGAGFVTEKLLSPREALEVFFARVTPPAPAVEYVPLDAATWRVLARDVDADDDYPNSVRSAMDGFALRAAETPGDFAIAGTVRMGEFPADIGCGQTMAIPTGGSLPAGADAVVPIEDVARSGPTLRVAVRLAAGENAIPRAADMRRGETILRAGTRIAAPQAGVLATLGIVDVPVFCRPLVGVLSGGDELVAVSASPSGGRVRDSNRYAIAASLRAMGARVRHYPRIGDEPGECERALRKALRECAAVAMSGGSSVGERDRLPAAVVALGEPGIIVHGLRIKPGKPALLGAFGDRPILGLPGNPASALLVLEAVLAPIVAALVGAAPIVSTVAARLVQPARGRAGWTGYLPVRLRHEGAEATAEPLPLRSFSASLAARADGYLVMDEPDEEWPAGTPVTVHRFLGG